MADKSPNSYAEWVANAVDDLLAQDKVVEADAVWQAAQVELKSYPPLLAWLENEVNLAIADYKRRHAAPVKDVTPTADDGDAAPASAVDTEREQPRPRKATAGWEGARKQADAAIDKGVSQLKRTIRAKFGRRRGKWRPTIFNQAGEVLIWLLLAVLGGVLWRWGGLFTILTVEAMFFDGRTVIQDLGPWQWLVPMGVSALETIWWPLNAPTPLRLMFFAVTAIFDILSTAYGAALWLAGRNFPLWVGGIQAPATTAEFSGILVAAILVSSIIVTFGPERLLIAALREGLGAFLAFWICLWNLLKGWSTALANYNS